MERAWRPRGPLPAPLAVALARYVGDVRDVSSTVPPAFSFIEAALCLLAYVSYTDFCAMPRRAKTRIFANFPHRSASYLWHLLRSVIEQSGNHSGAAHPLHRLLDAKNRDIIDRVTRGWAETRHEISSLTPNEILSGVRLLANMAHSIFSRYRFGFFQGVQKERFAARYSGRYRLAHGKPPYTESAHYTGSIAFSEAESLLVDTDKGDALSLGPLVIWYPCGQHRDTENGHCFVFDKLIKEKNGSVARFKALGFPCSLEVTAGNEETAELLTQIMNLYAEDPKTEWFHDLRMSATTG
jgi:hypothetical protein